jgi:hypothetical protein
METTGQQPAPPPCQCDQQLSTALPLLLLVAFGLFLLDRWRGRRGKKKGEQRVGTSDDGSKEGGKP